MMNRNPASREVGPILSNPELAYPLYEISLIEVLNCTTRRTDDLVIVLGHFAQKNRERPSTAFADDFLLLGHFGFPDCLRCYQVATVTAAGVAIFTS
jgi:hypothetical protein